MFKIEMDLSAMGKFYVAAMEAVGGRLPKARRGLRNGMEALRLDWILFVSGPPLSDGQYAKELEGRRPETPWNGDPYSVAVSGGRRAYQREYGAPAWDMKPGLLKGRLYVDVPFRHGTPGAVRFDPMIKEVFSAVRKSNVGEPGFPESRGGAKGLIPRVPAPGPDGKSILTPIHPIQPGEANRLYTNPFPQGGTIHTGQRTKIGIPGSATGGAALTPIHGARTYTWKTGKYEAMVRIGDTIERAFQGRHNRYMTFRRISSRSDAASWWYPRIDAHPHIGMIRDRNIQQIKTNVAAGLMEDFGLAGKGA